MSFRSRVSLKYDVYQQLKQASSCTIVKYCSAVSRNQETLSWNLMLLKSITLEKRDVGNVPFAVSSSKTQNV